MDQRCFELVHNVSIKLNRKMRSTTSHPKSTVHCTEGICDVRVERIRHADTARLLGVATPTSTLQDPLRHRDMVLRAAWVEDSGVSDVVPVEWIERYRMTRCATNGKQRPLRMLWC